MDLRKSLYQTIAFFDLFDFPLTAEEIQEQLFDHPKPVHIKEVEGTLQELPGVEKIKDYYVLKGRDFLPETRKTRKFISEKFWARVRLYGGYMQKIPFVRMVAVCNNLAYNNASEQSDIDLLVVIEHGRMWTARFLITLMLQFFGVRRHGDKIAGRFCLSFFVSTHKLDFKDLQIKPRDPYLAYWMKTLAPIDGKETYEMFQKLNRYWLEKDYGLKFTEENQRHLFLTQPSRFKKVFEWILNGRLGNFFEHLLQKTFKKRTLRKFKALGPEANVIVREDMLKFHNHDRREEYHIKWEKRVKELMDLPIPSETDA